MFKAKMLWRAFTSCLAIYGLICLTNQITGKAMTDVSTSLHDMIFGPEKGPVIDVKFEEV